MVLFFRFCISSVKFYFFFKQKTAYELRISDCSSDVCSSDLRSYHPAPQVGIGGLEREIGAHGRPQGTDAVLDMRGARPFGGSPGIDDDRAVDSACAFLGRGDPLPLLDDIAGGIALDRPTTDTRRRGKECARTCRSRWTT